MQQKNLHLEGSDLRGADFSGANLTNTNLSGADLSGATFAGAQLIGTNFTGAKLKNVILDKDVVVRPGAQLMGTPTNPVIVKRGEIV